MVAAQWLSDLLKTPGCCVVEGTALRALTKALSSGSESDSQFLDLIND